MKRMRPQNEVLVIHLDAKIGPEYEVGMKKWSRSGVLPAHRVPAGTEWCASQ